MTNKKLASYSLIVAIYVALSLVLNTFSFGTIQLRISEVLIVLVLSNKDYIIPITLGCFLTNLIGVVMGFNPIVLDTLVGTLATYLSCLLAYKLKNITWFNKPILSLLMPAIINGLFVGLELTLILSSFTFSLFMFNFFMIFISEFIICVIFGSLLYGLIQDRI